MIIIIDVILTILSAYQVINIKMNADFATYLQHDDPLVQQYNMIGDKSGGKSSKTMKVKFFVTKEGVSFYKTNLIRELLKIYNRS